MKQCFTVLAFVLALALSRPASAALVWGMDASGELSGSRDDTQLVTSGAWDDDFTISWNISQEDSYWYYQYCIDAKKDPSHLILEVTRDCNFQLFSRDDFEGPKLFDGDYLPEDIFGVKFEFDDCQSCFSFKTERAPVYGSFYAKSGYDSTSQEWTFAYNTGLLGNGCDPYDFIVRPDGDGPIPTPEPATMAMLGLGLGALGISRRRRRSSAS